MEWALLLAGILAANTAGILSPGPAVVLVARHSVGVSRRAHPGARAGVDRIAAGLVGAPGAKLAADA